MADLKALSTTLGLNPSEHLVKPVIAWSLTFAGAPQSTIDSVQTADLSGNDMMSTVENVLSRGHPTYSDLEVIMQRIGLDLHFFDDPVQRFLGTLGHDFSAEQLEKLQQQRNRFQLLA